MNAGFSGSSPAYLHDLDHLGLLDPEGEEDLEVLPGLHLRVLLQRLHQVGQARVDAESEQVEGLVCIRRKKNRE